MLKPLLHIGGSQTAMNRVRAMADRQCGVNTLSTRCEDGPNAD